MKSEKGITLISLTIYIIAMAIIVGAIAIISTYFYTNIDNVEQQIDPIAQYTKFNSFFSDEVNHSNLKILECEQNYVDKNGNTINYIVFDNGVQYTYIPENEGIYRNKVKICSGIKKCVFYYEIKNGKDVVRVDFNSGSRDQNITYTLKN